MNILKGSVYLTESTLLRKKTCEKNPDRIPLVITCNRFLPNITKTNRKNCNILQINEKRKKSFKNEPITAFERNKIIHKIIRTHWIKN